MNEKLTPITPAQAEEKDFKQLTYPIDPTTEQWIIDNVVSDLRKGNIPVALVSQEKGLEVWRGPRF